MTSGAAVVLLDGLLRRLVLPLVLIAGKMAVYIINYYVACIFGSSTH